jgi:hypothetical protein
MRKTDLLQRRPCVKSITLAVLGMLVAGCAPSVSRVSVPPADQNASPPVRETTAPKANPREGSESQLPAPPFDDQPLVSQATPEQSAFVDTYNRVGRPRIAIVIDKEKEDQNDEFAKSYDDEAIREELADWMACNGRVAVVNSAAPEDSDVTVKMQAHMTRQYQDAMRIRILAEATNTKDHISIGRAFVDVPPPLEKTQINRYTRWLARKLMDEMTASWQAPEPGNGPEQAGPQTQPPTTAPAR